MRRTCQRSSVRGLRRNSAASSSLVRKSARMGSAFDIDGSYALLRAQRTTSTDIQVGGIINVEWEEFSHLFVERLVKW